jgi:hypothetical protein
MQVNLLTVLNFFADNKQINDQENKFEKKNDFENEEKRPNEEFQKH